MKRNNLIKVLFIILLFSCKKEKSEPFKVPQNILFIGNSFTYFNDGLAYHLKNFVANDSSIQIIRVEEISINGYTLENHWNNPQTINKIKENRWDIIILQEQSLMPINNKEKMFYYAEKFNSLIRKTGKARLIFFMTWAYKSYPEMLNKLSDSYMEIAKKLRAEVVPVGLAWDKINKQNNTINLYYADGRHPNINGTFFTACIFYHVLFNKDPSLNQYKDLQISENTSIILKQLASKTNGIQY